MKKLFFLLIAAGCTASATAQNKAHPATYADAFSPRWALDVNVLGGAVSQTFKTANTAANYPDAITSNTGQLQFRNGYSYGADAQIGYFFGKARHFGLGTGIMFMEQRGVASLSNYHIDARATDAAGHIFRQVLTGNDVRENVRSSMVNIPVMLKYKNRFSKHWGFAADAGALINIQMRNAYSTHATFDQGAIYKFVQNTDGGTVSVYDNSPTPSPDSWLITKAEFLNNNPGGNWQEYASVKRAMGINVGDGLTTRDRTGNTTYRYGSLGFMVQPSVSYYLSDNVALNFGGYYMMQPIKNNAQNGYRLTDGNGSYSSVLNNVTATTVHAYGVNAGARFFIGMKDRDHDHVADRKDECVDVYGLKDFHGCPDTDSDGIQDSKDSCITVKGVALFNGCPDTDADSIQDREDECPFLAGPRALNGCPDKDKDGIADKNDLCPSVFGLAMYRGCPDTDGDNVPDNNDNCIDVAGPVSNKGCPVIIEPATSSSMTTPILFEVNMATIKQSSMPGIEDAVAELNRNQNATITIDGHADASGPESANKVLSLERANSVKVQLTQRGINAKRLKVKGHGSKVPVATNSTYEGKQQNRRAAMRLSPSGK